MADPKPPTHLERHGRSLWRSVVSEYDLLPHQLQVLEHACMASDRGHAAAAIVRAEGVMTQDRFGVARQHPAVATERDARLAVARLIRELALDPGDVFEAARVPGIRPV